MNKKVEKPYVYKREYDLTKYDTKVLQKYNLEQDISIYDVSYTHIKLPMKKKG
ncbi:hypothetical protein [Clostridioides difficile]|uniref:hypothetical protein n=1 Tax=Clostridioides difficile TaxID=1496 RepID=UPI001595ABB6|nr:hypothetical protein [Clostridioides difficile]